jgi:hypothetical protein
VQRLETQEVNVTKIPSSAANGQRGTVVAVQVDPKTSESERSKRPAF